MKLGLRNLDRTWHSVGLSYGHRVQHWYYTKNKKV